MAILFAEDFKGYGTNAALLLDGLWGTFNNAELVPDPDPNASGNVAHFINFGNAARRPFAKGALTIGGAACRLWLNTLPNFTVNVLRFLDGGNAVQCSLAFTPTGIAQIWVGSAGGYGSVLLGQTVIPVIAASAWHHIEFKVDTAGGHAEARIDGVSVLIVQGNVGVIYQLGLGTTDDRGGSPGVYAYLKDLVTWDGTGDHNNTFLGTVSVISMVPDADASLNWTPSTGATGFNLLDTAPPDDANKYITAALPVPPAAVFSLADLPPNVSSVRALISQVRARKSDGGDGNIQIGLLSDAVEVDGQSRPVTTAFTYYEDVFETDPDTTAPWTPAGANDVQFKINRTA